MQLRSNRPINKVQVSFVASALSTILIWVLVEYAHIDMPEYIAAAIITLVGSLVAYVTPLLPGEVSLTLPIPTPEINHVPIVLGNGGKHIEPEPAARVYDAPRDPEL